MEGFWKTLLEKVSIEIFFMTLCLFGLSLIGLIFFTNQISFVFLIAYVCLSVSLSYFLSRFIVFIVSTFKEKQDCKKINEKFQCLSSEEREALISVLSSGNEGKLIHKQYENAKDKLILLEFIIAKDKFNGGYYSYIVNPNHKKELINLLQSFKLDSLH